jgi:pimeloyl-ACP methyl ester carboxylesterase
MRPIVFIHGMFMNPQSWEGWIRFFEQRGYSCSAPTWPFHEGDPSTLRSSIPEALGKLKLHEVAAVFEKQIRALPEKPILIGHSMGGLITQLLVANDLAAAGICIDSAAPNGMLVAKWSFFKSNLPVINALKGSTPVLLSKKQFQYAFCNTMSEAESNAVWENYVVPESRNVARSSSGKDGKIDVTKPHAPLLFIAGENDHIIPAALNRKNHKAYTDRNSVADFKEFPGRTHFICGQQGWEEVATHVADWIATHVNR